jgi:signal transduction histidine kinase
MAGASKPCLLVVDDEADLVQSVKDLLRFDFRVLGATRASEGLRLMQGQEVHLVMSDQRMPEMTGVEFLSQLRDTHPNTVRLLFTAYADLGAVIDAINQGSVYRYISKPWQPDELRTVLRQSLDYYNLQAERRRLIQELQQKNVQLEQANTDLQRANDLKRAFIKVASHELRTPLTIVVGLAELAARSGEATAATKQWMQQVWQGGVRLTERVNQMVKLLQAERFERPLVPQPVNLADALNQAFQDVASFAQLRQQQLQLELAPELGTVRVEPDKLRDSVVQLLMNAIKFTPDGGVIRLAARRLPDGSAQITVSDTGMGIDPASLGSIFEPFFTRFDVSRHSSGTFEYDRRGLGLGLSVAKAFIERQGGSISVDSQLGRGTTFTIILPAIESGHTNFDPGL